MLTPQDIQGKEFVKAVFGGYDMSAVDEFLEQLTQDYGSLYKENAILKSKIKVLVEKVEEYRSTEDAMRMALLTAQRMGEDLMTEAKTKRQSMIDEADATVKAKMEELARAVADEENRLAKAKERTLQFVEASNIMLKRHSEFLSKLDELKDEQSVTTEEKPKAKLKAVPDEKKENEIISTAHEIDSRVSSIVSDTKGTVKDDGKRPFRTTAAPGVNWSDDDEPTSPRPKFDFSDLKFGSNYGEDE